MYGGSERSLTLNLTRAAEIYNSQHMVQRVAIQNRRPRFIEPMECKRVPKLPEGDAWCPPQKLR